MAESYREVAIFQQRCKENETPIHRTSSGDIQLFIQFSFIIRISKVAPVAHISETVYRLSDWNPQRNIIPYVLRLFRYSDVERKVSSKVYPALKEALRREGK
jgi:hypothetical protein